MRNLEELREHYSHPSPNGDTAGSLNLSTEEKSMLEEIEYAEMVMNWAKELAKKETIEHRNSTQRL
jgi:hypothetical protein